MQENLTQLYVDMIPNLAAMAKTVVRDLDPQVCQQMLLNSVWAVEAFTRCCMS